MSGLKAILITVGVVFAVICAVLIVLAIIWLIGNYGFDRLIDVISLLLGVASFAFSLIVYFRRRL